MSIVVEANVENEENKSRFCRLKVSWREGQHANSAGVTVDGE